MKKTTICHISCIMATAVASSICSYRSAENRIEQDVNNALEMALAQLPRDVISADTIQCYRSNITIEELRDTARIAMRTVSRGERQETVMVAEANCDVMTVFL